ncbi:copper homeostasis protein CutC [Alkalimonas collagenimarina]|uniref:Copper homeostasis protein cutC homolog n=1 Tax=Alkalimonas collagenimarina TaxID=400390 RepID=A0ABT9H020_9GAMM|nr:copper homeostasis protein CutC [Alkalimonas collagenimarina]MDP4536662.1 copper homeostasis protein CutC [Alkalimonas collagenimarina]
MRAELEVCLASDQGPLTENIQLASAVGVGSIELCASMHQGGLTPASDVIAQARRHCTDTTRLMVMIRPRAGGFHYQADELQLMARQMKQAADLGADGVVFGCLTADGAVDHQAMELLMQRCVDYQLVSTFHRAFDASQSPEEVLYELQDYPLQRILTNGTHWQSGLGIEAGISQLRRLQQSSFGGQWVFGGGVTLGLLPKLQQQLQPAYWHFHRDLLQQHRLLPDRLAQALQLLGHTGDTPL